MLPTNIKKMKLKTEEDYDRKADTMSDEKKMYKLMDENGQEYLSPEKGTLGGNGKDKIYGRLDCPAALRAIRQGGYTQYRVFFKDEATAIAAGFRPCGTCMREHFKLWKDGKIIPGNLEETKKNVDF